MPYSTYAKNLMLTELALVATFASIHTDIPDGIGSNELIGGDPAYIRKAITWGVAANGEVSLATFPVFDIPGGGTTINNVGFWDAEIAGNFLGSMSFIPETYNSQGTTPINNAKLDLNKV